MSKIQESILLDMWYVGLLDTYEFLTEKEHSKVELSKCACVCSDLQFGIFAALFSQSNGRPFWHKDSSLDLFGDIAKVDFPQRFP